MKELDYLRRRYGGHRPGLLGARHSYAVLCPLVERDGALHLLFEVRAAGLRQQGEVCFPGGRMEAGETVEQCALRETAEELAIPPEQVTVLGTPDFICNQRGFLLQPVLGLVSPAGFAAMSPSPAEVAEAFTAPLDFFRQTPPEVYTYDLAPRCRRISHTAWWASPPTTPGAHGRVEVPVWYWHGHAIWGMTAWWSGI